MMELPKTLYLCANRADSGWLNKLGYRAAAAVGLMGGVLAPEQLPAWVDGLPAADRYVLVGDQEDDGGWLILRHSLVAILGAVRCWFTDWPEGIFTIHQFEKDRGVDALKEYLDRAAPWPVDGLYTLDEMPEPPKLELWRTGFADIGEKLQIAPTMLSVVTGTPGHGKTQMFQQIWFQIAERYGIKVAIFSAETRVKPHVRRTFRQIYHGNLERHLTPEQIAEADDFIRRHFIFMAHSTEKATMKWLLDTIEVAVLRHRVRAILIDPWNKIAPDYDTRTTTETAWIGWCLDKFTQMARSLNVHIQIIAHPAKPDSMARKGPPDLYSIAASAHWANAPDQGFSIHRPKIISDEDGTRQTGATLRCLKARFPELGYPAEFKMNFNLQTGVFECAGRDSAGSPAGRGDDGWGRAPDETQL